MSLFFSRVGINWKLNRTLFAVLKSTSKSKVALNFETAILLYCFLSTIEFPLFYLDNRVEFLIAKLTNWNFAYEISYTNTIAL